MMSLERLDEALKFYGHPDSYTGLEEVVLSAAAAYRDLLANGERVEPDYERLIGIGLDAATQADGLPILGEEAIRAVWRAVPAAVDAAIGDKLLVDYPTEGE